jgi:5-(carboxyamino)imidazole ribonucleotide synthase
VTLVPPATIGVVGGGQLGMMTIREAQRMGYRSVVWDPDPLCPASRVADDVITAPFDDLAAAEKIARAADVVTYEFENVNAGAIRAIERERTVYPGTAVLEVTQHRRREKETLRRYGFPTAEFRIAETAEELRRAVSELGLPVVVKTATSGYDGKGQSVLQSSSDVERFFQSFVGGGQEFVVERFVDLACELSVIAVRTQEGHVERFPVGENVHRNNILHRTTVPATVAASVVQQAEEIGASVVEAFGLVGVLCIEMFVTKDGTLLVNELAPRPHNSGHYSLDACTCSQFEALVRAVCGLPVVCPRLTSPCAMVNILGKHFAHIDYSELYSWSGVKLHLYGKQRVEPNRKMGHITILAETPQDVERRVAQVEQMIGER